MDRRVMIDIQAGRKLSGVLRGYDIFLNLVVDEAYEVLGAGERKFCGQVVSLSIADVDWCCWALSASRICRAQTSDLCSVSRSAVDGFGPSLRPSLKTSLDQVAGLHLD